VALSKRIAFYKTDPLLSGDILWRHSLLQLPINCLTLFAIVSDYCSGHRPSVLVTFPRDSGKKKPRANAAVSLVWPLGFYGNRAAEMGCRSAHVVGPLWDCTFGLP